MSGLIREKRRHRRRDLAERLEADLWAWREACKEEGKNFTKRMVQARAKWAFHKEGMSEFKASDGWYWKWLSRWKKKNQAEQQDTFAQSDVPMSIRVTPASPLSSDLAREASDFLTHLKSHDRISTHDNSTSEESILLNLDDLNSSLVFFRPSQPDEDAFLPEDLQGGTTHDLDPGGLTDDLFSTSANLESILDSASLASIFATGEFCERDPEPEVVDGVNEGLGVCNQKMQPLICLRPTLPSTSELRDDFTSSFAQWSPSSTSTSSYKENSEPFSPPADAISMSPPDTENDESKTSTNLEEESSNMSEIAKRRKQGSLKELKDQVLKYAEHHTFKETGKKFGVHHSTVSGWVRAEEKEIMSGRDASAGNRARLTTDLAETGSSLRADLAFVSWLRTMRKEETEVTMEMVREKVAEVMGKFGKEDMETNCKWFLMWNTRREEKSYVEGMEDEGSQKPREVQNLAYPPAFKLEVALYAKQFSQYAASKVFSVARRRIFDWMRQTEKLEELIARGHLKKMTGRGPKNRDIDRQLYHWYCTQRSQGQRPKSSCVQMKAREMYRQAGYLDIKCSYGWFKRWSQRFRIKLRYSYDEDLLEWILSRFEVNKAVTLGDLQEKGRMLVTKEDPTFKASSGWVMRFCRRHLPFLNPNLSYLCHDIKNDIGSDFNISNANNIGYPSHLLNRSESFQELVRNLIKERNLNLGQIGCMDELPIHFNSGQIGQNSPAVSMRQAGLAGSQAVVILAGLADGSLLPPLLVLKNKQNPDSQPFLANGRSGVAYRLQNTETLVLLSEDDNDVIVDADVICHWLQFVWFRRVEKTALLLTDCFGPHVSGKVREKMTGNGGCLAVIPVACSAKLNPMMMGTTRKFKSLLDQYFAKTIVKNPQFSGDHTPYQLQIIHWVDKAYKIISENKERVKAHFQLTIGENKRAEYQSI